MINLDMACQVCTYALNPIDATDGITFEHPVTPDGGDHAPVPVPAHQLPQVYRRCHLCSAAQPLWVYRTEPVQAMSIGAAMISQTYSAQWHACPTCAELIEAGDTSDLTRRCAGLMGWKPRSLEYTILGSLHEMFVTGRESGRGLLTTGTWPPAAVKAPMLPKVRDRLTALLRGPVGLPAPLDAARTVLGEHLEQAKLYWIDDEFTGLVDEVLADQPGAAVTDRIVPAGSGLLAWSAPVDSRHRLAAVSWSPTPDGWHLVGYRSFGPGLPALSLERARRQIGWLIPAHSADVARGHIIDGSDPLAALAVTWLIIAQQLTQQEAAPAEPSIRRAYSRAGHPPPQIRIVRIKPATVRAVTAAVAGRSAAGRAAPDHRYWVSAHTRNQAYGPGRSLRREVDIDPFLKGPAGAPIKASTTVRVLGGRRPRDEQQPPGGR